MKVGLILECGPSGPDEQVCRWLIGQLRENVTVEVATLTNKQILLRECGPAAARLLAMGCDHVVIVWDLRPAWGTKTSQPCRRNDREAIQKSLTSAGVNLSNVFLVCIEAMLEAWLLADERALEAVLKRPTHPVSVPRIRRPEAELDPKARLMTLFRQNGRPPYTDVVDAIKIAKAMPDLKRLRRCSTFARFALKAVGVTV